MRNNSDGCVFTSLSWMSTAALEWKLATARMLIRVVKVMIHLDGWFGGGGTSLGDGLTPIERPLGFCGQWCALPGRSALCHRSCTLQQRQSKK